MLLWLNNRCTACGYTSAMEIGVPVALVAVVVLVVDRLLPALTSFFLSFRSLWQSVCVRVRAHTENAVMHAHTHTARSSHSTTSPLSLIFGLWYARVRVLHSCTQLLLAVFYKPEIVFRFRFVVYSLMLARTRAHCAHIRELLFLFIVYAFYLFPNTI